LELSGFAENILQGANIIIIFGIILEYLILFYQVPADACDLFSAHASIDL